VEYLSTARTLPAATVSQFDWRRSVLQLPSLFLRNAATSARSWGVAVARLASIRSSREMELTVSPFDHGVEATLPRRVKLDAGKPGENIDGNRLATQVKKRALIKMSKSFVARG
jgi:hypothetical protein